MNQVVDIASHVEPSPPGTLHVQLDDGVLVPIVLRGWVEDPALPGYRIELEVRVPTESRRRPYASDVRVVGNGVDGTVLRKLKVNEYVRLLLDAASKGASGSPDAPAAIDRIRFINTPRHGHLSEEVLQTTTTLYQRAMRDPILRSRPTQYVAEQKGVGRSTAARYVKGARDLGLLGPARGTAPGELPDPPSTPGRKREGD